MIAFVVAMAAAAPFEVDEDPVVVDTVLKSAPGAAAIITEHKTTLCATRKGKARECRTFFVPELAPGADITRDGSVDFGIKQANEAIEATCFGGPRFQPTNTACTYEVGLNRVYAIEVRVKPQGKRATIVRLNTETGGTWSPLDFIEPKRWGDAATACRNGRVDYVQRLVERVKAAPKPAPKPVEIQQAFEIHCDEMDLRNGFIGADDRTLSVDVLPNSKRDDLLPYAGAVVLDGVVVGAIDAMRARRP